MELIKIKEDFVDAKVWLVQPRHEYKLTNPSSSLDGINNFVLTTTHYFDVKCVWYLSKKINLLGEAVTTIEFTPVTLTGVSTSVSLLKSSFYESMEEADANKVREYMHRIVAALTRMENAATNAASLSAGSDSNTLTMEESEARVRHNKADKRLQRMITELAEKEKDTGWQPAYLIPDLDEVVSDYIASV